MKITVFTPTFNRAYILENLYNSLQSQTYTNFEWLVIDDGSTDNTAELFNNWIRENKLHIRYHRVENGGKHRAINKATDLASGELFFIVDSDDYLTEDALESIVQWEGTIENKEEFCGVSGNRGKSKTDLWGTTFEGEYIDASSLERNKKNITGDKAEVFYTKLLQKYKFKEFEDENFITEATVWNRMAADGYKIRWFNKTIYICNYLNDGLTNNMKIIFANNPRGTAYYINQQIKYYQCNFKGKLSYYNLYFELVKEKLGLRKAAKYLEVNPIIILSAFMLVSCKKLLTGR
ncbi:glycosyltransferase family 2 protein [Bacillus sp. 1P10SD]|uniref:glycosyltransferase family 2 protein n=1 Tax=Bacillus sp. 1P10SD TaxID=3132265 RepID=UPI0039A5DEE2